MCYRLKDHWTIVLTNEKKNEELKHHLIIVIHARRSMPKQKIRYEKEKREESKADESADKRAKMQTNRQATKHK